MPGLSPDILRSLVSELDNWPVFVETGTYLGETICRLEPLFDELHTIELSVDHWRNAKGAYVGKKIQFHLGDSASVLDWLLPAIKRPAVFFLDGHWSCGNTARGPIDVPLLNELSSICQHFLNEALVIIDDIRLFGKGPDSGEPVDWTSIGIEAIQSVVAQRCRLIQKDVVLDKLVILLSALRC